MLLIQLHVSFKIHSKLNIRNYLATGLSAGISVIIVLFVIQEDQVLVTTPSVSSYLYEAQYYQQHTNSEMIAANQFQVKAYDVQISAYRKLEVDAKVKIVSLESFNKAVFTLYHNFDVKEVKEVNGKPLSYNQKGDSIEILFDSDLSSGETIELVFTYSGVSSPFSMRMNRLFFCLTISLGYLLQVNILQWFTMIPQDYSKQLWHRPEIWTTRLNMRVLEKFTVIYRKQDQMSGVGNLATV